MQINPCQKKFITPVEFEALFSIGTDAQSIWRSKGILPYIKLGGRKVLYDREKIEKWIARHEVDRDQVQYILDAESV
jgi:hypothetical protein